MCNMFRCGNAYNAVRNKDNVVVCRLTKDDCPACRDGLFDVSLCDIVNYSDKKCVFCDFRLGCLYK